MRKTIILISLLFVAFQSYAQDLSDITQNQRQKDKLQGTPRQRVSTSTSLNLTDQWQTIVFVSGNSNFDINTFPQARWDFVNNKMVLNPDNSMEQSYDLSFDYTLTNVKGQSKVQMRFVVPAPSPVYFPFPDDAANAYVDMSEVNMPGTYKRHFQFPIYGNASMRQYGLQIQMRVQSYVASSNILSGVISLLSTVLTGTDRVVLNNCSLNIYAK